MNPMLLLASAEQALANGQPYQDLSIYDPVSPPAQSIVNLSVLVLAIAALIFITVEIILFYSVIRFRQRTSDDRTQPAQVYGSQPIEIAWTAAPTLIVFILVLVTARTIWEVEVPLPQPHAGDNTLFVTVIGHQWWWEYAYRHHNGEALDFVTANELHVPASTDGIARNTFLVLESADVCHSYWVPRLAGKIDLIPGKVNNLWFRSATPGLYLGQCAEYCGTQHAHMLLRVYVDPPDQFERWLDNQRKAARPPADAAGREAQEAFLRQSCVNCHAVRGTSARGTYAPDLTHLMSRETLASGMFPRTPENLARWVDDPKTIKPGCLMPGFKFTGRERDLVLRYLQSLD